MKEALRRARRFLDFLGFPSEDTRAYEPSTRRFGDGSAAGVEVVGIQEPGDLRALLDECDRLGIPPPNRVIETQGFDGLSRRQASELIRIAADRGVGLVASIGPRAGRGRGSFVRTPQGARLACRLRGVDQLAHGLADALRSIELGVRALLVYDEGLLELLGALRDSEEIPQEVRLKASIALGCANPVHARQLEGLGADSLNPVNDLDPSMLAAVRTCVSIALDVHVDDAPEAGGIDRTWELPELIDAAAPVFLKTGSLARGSGATAKAHRLARVYETLERECGEVRLLKPGALESGPPVPE